MDRPKVDGAPGKVDPRWGGGADMKIAVRLAARSGVCGGREVYWRHGVYGCHGNFPRVGLVIR